MRKYIAIYDNGHDWGEFVFESKHRANSKANLADAEAAYRRRFGARFARNTRIVKTQLCDYD